MLSKVSLTSVFRPFFRTCSTVSSKVKPETVSTAVERAQNETNEMQHKHYTLQQKMTLSSRILGEQGHGYTLSGQITVRHQNTDNIQMWVNVYGKPFEVLTPDDFVLVDKDLTVLEGKGFPNRATRFHSHIYDCRDDINCIIHTHAPHTSSLSMTGTPLFISHMDTMAFYEDVQYLPEWPGIPFGDEEGEIISRVLGKEHFSALLAHHGLIVCGKTIEETTYKAFFFEKAAEMQLRAMAAVGGDIKKLKKVKRELALKAKDWRLSEGPVKAHFNGWAEIIIQKNSEFFRNLGF